MENIRNFLEASTIHGLSYISTSRKYIRLFWTLVVIGGFTGAGYIIYQSFQDWNESPVKTTIETLPITKLRFPKITVCPPKNTFTDLNYDLMMTENTTLDNDTRDELTNYAAELLYDHLYDKIIRNLSKIEEEDRYYNWYHGYTQIKIPYIHGGYVRYYVNTAASSGNISTQYFGEEFDAAKVQTKISYQVRVYPPASLLLRTNPTTTASPLVQWGAGLLGIPQTQAMNHPDPPNVTLHLRIEKVLLKDLSSGNEVMAGGDSKNYTPPQRGPPPRYDFYKIILDRNVPSEYVRIQELDRMPGFRITWHYSGMKVEPEAKYDNKAFVRNGSIVSILFCKTVLDCRHVNSIYQIWQSQSTFKSG